MLPVIIIPNDCPTVREFLVFMSTILFLLDYLLTTVNPEAATTKPALGEYVDVREIRKSAAIDDVTQPSSPSHPNTMAPSQSILPPLPASPHPPPNASNVPPMASAVAVVEEDDDDDDAIPYIRRPSKAPVTNGMSSYI